MKTDWLIVGAGYTGAVLAERIASQCDQQVIVIDQRDHIAGNAHDYYDDHGILVHKYGPHIFHTNSKRIWDYLSRFTSWRPYFHEARAIVEGKSVPVPFNLNSLDALFPRCMAERLERRLVESYGFGVKVPILRMLEHSDNEVKELARYINRNVFENYTVKQWGLKPEELDPSVTARIPVYISRDDRYFQDEYQALPRLGYTEMFRRMLAHPNIKLFLKTKYSDVADQIQYERMIYSGPIDEYFNYIHGPLPYRSLRFDFRHETMEGFYQDAPQVNYPNNHLFTRVVEYKRMNPQLHSGTTLGYEYPEPHEPGVNTPYYPIPREENRVLYERYLKETEKLKGKVLFAGRLADYKYYNMDQAVGRALKVFEDVQSETEQAACGIEALV